MSEAPKSPFWWRGSVAPELAPNYRLGVPLPGTQPGQYGYDAMADILQDVEHLRGLYATGSPATKRMARMALEPLLLGAGMSPYDFAREFPPIAPEPTSLEKAALDLETVNEIVAFVNGTGGPPRPLNEG